MSNLRLEDREVTYHTEVHGKYSCSKSLQLTARNLGKCSHLGILDTGASHYMLNDKKLFVEGYLVDNNDKSAFLRLAGGNATLDIKAFGQYVQLKDHGDRMIFNDVLYVPDLTHNVFAGGRLARAGVTTEILKDPHFRLMDRKKEMFVGTFWAKVVLC